jgi:hypothetical protein
VVRGKTIENHMITQHFFFFTKRKPVLKEKQKCYEIAKSLKFTAEHTENAKAPENLSND